MDLKKYVKSNNILIKQDILDLCVSGIKTLGESKDPNHGIVHIQTMLDDLAELLKENVTVKNEIDFNVLVPSIIFHDFWYSTKKQTRNIFIFIFRLFYEGYGSKRLVGELLGDIVEPEIKASILKAIRIHPRSGIKAIDNIFFKRSTLEEKVLCDLDEINQWNLKRIKSVKDYYLKDGLKMTDALIVYLYFRLYIFSASDSVFSLKYFKKRFKMLHKDVANYFEQIYTEIYNSPEKYINSLKNSGIKINSVRSETTKTKLYGLLITLGDQSRSVLASLIFLKPEQIRKMFN